MYKHGRARMGFWPDNISLIKVLIRTGHIHVCHELPWRWIPSKFQVKTDLSKTLPSHDTVWFSNHRNLRNYSKKEHWLYEAFLRTFLRFPGVDRIEVGPTGVLLLSFPSAIKAWPKLFGVLVCFLFVVAWSTFRDTLTGVLSTPR